MGNFIIECNLRNGAGATGINGPSIDRIIESFSDCLTVTSIENKLTGIKETVETCTTCGQQIRKKEINR